jgi:hypothetical protein
MAKIARYLGRVTGENGKSPYISTETGNWMVYDDTEKIFTDTGVKGESQEVSADEIDLTIEDNIISMKKKQVNEKQVLEFIDADSIAYDENNTIKDRLNDFPPFYNPSQNDFSIAIPHNDEDNYNFEFFLNYDENNISYPDMLCLGGEPTLPDNTQGTPIKFDFGDTQLSTRIRSHERPVVWLDETPNDSTFPNGHFLSYKDELDSTKTELSLWGEIQSLEGNFNLSVYRNDSLKAIKLILAPYQLEAEFNPGDEIVFDQEIETMFPNPVGEDYLQFQVFGYSDILVMIDFTTSEIKIKNAGSNTYQIEEAPLKGSGTYFAQT